MKYHKIAAKILALEIERGALEIQVVSNNRNVTLQCQLIHHFVVIIISVMKNNTACHVHIRLHD